jgi:hypothetical protein
MTRFFIRIQALIGILIHKTINLKRTDHRQFIAMFSSAFIMMVARSSFLYMAMMFILGEGVEEWMALHCNREEKKLLLPSFEITRTPLLSNRIILTYW